MAEYSFAHLGINADNADQAREAAKLLGLLFGFDADEGDSSIFVGERSIELCKTPYLGAHGHIAIGTPDVAAAMAELEERGFTFDKSTAKYKPDGTLNAIYFTQELCGFALHLVGKK